MAQTSVAPIILRDVLLTIGGIGGVASATADFEKHVSQVEFTPSAAVQTWKGLTPAAVFSKGTTATWTCTLAYAQDWETTDSLSQFLHDQEGEEVSCTFEPVKGGATWAATLLITPGAVGGTVDAFAVATVTLGVAGKPTLS